MRINHSKFMIGNLSSEDKHAIDELQQLSVKMYNVNE